MAGRTLRRREGKRGLPKRQADKGNEKLYVQVTQELRSPKTEKREYDRLLEIHDNYPKYVLTTDEFSGGNYEGIKTMHIADFLLSSEY